MAMTCRTPLICRFPPRDSRWRTWSPEEASTGAVQVDGRDVCGGGEPGHVADLDDQPGGCLRAPGVAARSRITGLVPKMLRQLRGQLVTVHSRRRRR